MGFWTSVILLGLFVLGAVGYPEKDRVVNLKGMPESKKFEQYAGYVDIDDGKSIFYYFVQAIGDAPVQRPLTLWVNGGPGCSSVGIGAFTEVGPFYPNPDGRGLRQNLNSWNKVSNLLFVDSPVGVGWSYSKTSNYSSGDANFVDDTMKFLLKWFVEFAELNSTKFYLAGEGYAGHYLPKLAVAMLTHNVDATDFKFNLQGITIGNPLLRLSEDQSASYEFLRSHGAISDEMYAKITGSCNFSGFVIGSDKEMSSPCIEAMNAANAATNNLTDFSDVIINVCNEKLAMGRLQMGKPVSNMSLGADVCMPIERDFYFRLPEVQQALHANRTGLPYEWTMCSSLLNYKYVDSKDDMIPLLKSLIGDDIRVWIYSGDQAVIVPFLSTRSLVLNLATDAALINTVPYRAWHAGEDQVAGWTFEYGILTFATVRGASRSAPFTKPRTSFTLFDTFLAGRTLPALPATPRPFVGYAYST